MKMICRCGLITILTLCCFQMAYGGNGIKRSEWSFKPEITTDNMVIGMLGILGIRTFEQIAYNEDPAPWWVPYVSYKGNAGLYLQEDYTFYLRSSDRPNDYTMRYEDKIRLFDFKDIGYSFGGSITFMSKEMPLGFWAKLSYEKQVYKIKGESGVKGYMSEGEWIFDSESEMKYTSTIGKIIGEKITLSKQMIVPEAGFVIRFGNYRTAEDNFTIDLGARYDYALNSKGIYGGKDAVNSGVSWIIGFAFGRPDRHFQIGFNNELSFYDYFNKDYSPDGGRTYPFKNTHNGFRLAMSVYLRRGF